LVQATGAALLYQVKQMKVITHEPKTNRRSEHYAVQDAETWHALCAPYPAAGDRTHNGEWTVRDEQPGDHICWHCQAKLKRQNAPPPEPRQLPCTEPERKVELMERTDGKSLVHATTVRKQWAFCKAASRTEQDWQTRTGTAGEITCERCLKSLGLYEGHTPAKKSSGKLSHHARRELWDSWHKWTGEYHYSDPRVNG